MKRIAKIFAMIFSAVCLCFAVGCVDFLNELAQPSGRRSATFTVGYDYGEITEGKATLLLSGSELFFDPEEYDGLAPLIAGDELEVTYDGEMLIQETYPSRVVLKGRLGGVTKTKSATLASVTFGGIEEGKIKDGDMIFADLPEYVIEKDDTLTPLVEVKIGATLFIAYVDGGGEEFYATAIYAFSHDYPLTANEVIPWAAELSVDEIVEIEEKTFNASVGPNGFAEIRGTKDKGQIQNLLSYFQNAIYREAVNGEEEIEGGGTVVYTLRTEGEAYVYSTYAGYYSNEDGCYYPQRQAPIVRAEETHHQFFMTSEKCTLYVDGKAFKSYEHGLTEYTFKRSQKEPIYPSKKLVLVVDDWRLYLLDARTFLLDVGGYEELFEIVGEKDFSEIFVDLEEN